LACSHPAAITSAPANTVNAAMRVISVFPLFWARTFRAELCLIPGQRS
jgi:hypothetical protein